MKTALLQVADTVLYKPIPGLSGYEAGSDGTIWSKSHLGPKKSLYREGGWGLLNPTPDVDGYLRVTPSVNGKTLGPFGVHVLVLRAFVGQCPEGMEACHNDGDPSNNWLTNIRWDTVSNNNLDKREHGTAQTGERNGNHKLTDEQVREIRQLKPVKYVYGYQGRVAKQYGIDTTYVRAIWNNLVRKDVV